MRRCEHDVGGHEAATMDGDLRSLTGEADRGRRHPDGDPSPDERRRDRVVGAQHPDEGVLAGPGLEVQVRVRQRIGESPQEPAFDGQPIGHQRADAADVATAGDVQRPGVVLALQIVERGEVPERQEARLGVPDGAFHVALRGGARRAQDDGPCAQRAEQPDDLVVEPGP